MAGPGFSFIGDEEKKLVIDALETREINRYRFDEDNNGSNHSKVFTFEREFEAFLGVKHCIGMNSCTSALLIGMLSFGIGPGDEVIVPGYTFIATIACVIFTGATPVFAEIDDSLTLNPEDLIKKITPRTRAILCVHILGASCNMEALTSIARGKKLLLFEDVAQACGSEYNDKKLGSIGDFGAFSLNIFKTITAGDGGIFSTNSSEIYEKAFAIHDHGFKPFRSGVVDGSIFFGLNLRMHELAGAMALAQGRKLESIINHMRKQKRLFLSEIGDIPHARFRRLNDPKGECGSLIVLIFDSSEIAKAIASALGTITLIESKKHYYGHFIHLLNNENHIRNRFRDTLTLNVSDYELGMLPNTDDILKRSVALTVGVLDSYLGASFGIDVTSSQDEIKKKSAYFRHIIEQYIGKNKYL